MDHYERAACELMRALRGGRSQRALARRLRYRGNPITDWENGRHSPTAADALRCAEVCRWPVAESFHQFHTLGAPSKCDGEWLVSSWLDQLRGSMSQHELAERCRKSRFAVRRWLTGESQIKLDDFLRVLDAITGRMHDWVAALVPVEQVPSLREVHERAVTAKRLALDHPWTEALLRIVETRTARPIVDAEVASTLGLSKAEVAALVAHLQQAGIICRDGDGYAVVGTLTVDTRGNPGALSRVQAHWTEVARQRLTQPSTAALDWHGYNHISVSRSDLVLVQDKLRQVFADIRTLVAASQPVEEAALVLLHLIHWEATSSERPVDERRLTLDT